MFSRDLALIHSKYFSAKVLFLLALLFGTLVATFATPYMGIATIAYFLLIGGFCLRKVDSKLHGRFMLFGTGIDYSLVIFLELQRSAINTAMEFSLTLPQQLHILCSTLAMILYIPGVYIGVKRYKGKLTSLKSLKLHKYIGLSTLILRTLGFILMFSLLSKYT